MWPNSKVDRIQVDRTKREQNPELTEPILSTSLDGQNVIWPDSQEDQIQVRKYPDEQNAKWARSQIEKVLYEHNPK